MLNKVALLTGVGRKKTFNFTLREDGGPTFTETAEEGMTWGDWVLSNYYRTSQIVAQGGYIKNSSGNMRVCFPDFYEENLARVNMGYWFQTADMEIYPDGVNGYYYRGVCYRLGTLITLADGSVKRVEDLTYDDELLVWDFDNGCFATAKAIWITKPMTTDHYYRLRFSDGTEIDLIGSDGDCHRLFNVENGEFTYGSRFFVGQHTVKDDGSTPYLVSIELIEEECVYYNVATHFHMNCYANGLLSSCRYNNLYPVKDMKFVKDEREHVPFSAYEGVPKVFYDSLRLGEQDLSKRPVEETKKYVKRIMSRM